MENLSTLRHKLCENCSKNFSSVFAHFPCSSSPFSLSPFIRSYLVRVWLCAIALCCHISLPSLARCPMTFHFCVVHINCSLYHYLLWLDSFDKRWEEGRDYTVARWLLCVDTEWVTKTNLKRRRQWKLHISTSHELASSNSRTKWSNRPQWDRILHLTLCEVGNKMRNTGFLVLSSMETAIGIFVSNHHRANDISLQTKLFAP